MDIYGNSSAQLAKLEASMKVPLQASARGFGTRVREAEPDLQCEQGGVSGLD